MWIAALVLCAHGAFLAQNPSGPLHAAPMDARLAVFQTQLLVPRAPTVAPRAPDFPRALTAPSLPKKASTAAPRETISAPATAQAPSDAPSEPITPVTTIVAPSAPSAPSAPAVTQADRSATAVEATKPEAMQTTAPLPEPELLAAASAAPAAAPKTATAPSSEPVQTHMPASVRLLYDIKGEIKGLPIYANGELRWQHNGSTYDARMEISHFLLGSRVQTSKGLVGPQGLEPVRFGDKVRSEVAAHFERSKGKVSYSANTPDEVLQPGAQDQLSIFMQLAGMLAAQPHRYDTGSLLSFQAVGPRSSETWVFKVAAPAALELPAGNIHAVLLTKAPVHEHDSRAEVWLATDMDYLPVRIRLTQSNGDFVDQRLRTVEPSTPAR